MTGGNGFRTVSSPQFVQERHQRLAIPGIERRQRFPINGKESGATFGAGIVAFFRAPMRCIVTMSETRRRLSQEDFSEPGAVLAAACR